MDISILLTESGKEKAKAYIKGLEEKRRHILDAKLDSARDVSIPTIDEIIQDIAWECKGIDYSEYVCLWGVTEHYKADTPLHLNEGIDFILLPQLSDFYKWHISRDKEGYVEVEGVGELEYEMTLSSEYSDDECMRVQIDGRYYYFG